MAKTVGVLGGMGPAATVDFMRRVIEATPATCDQEHVHMIVDHDPAVPDRTAAIFRRGPDPSPQLARMARRLEAAGADLLVMPCNSAHAFAASIRGAISIPLIDWPAVAAHAAAERGATSVGVLATSGTIASGVYATALADVGCSAATPQGEDQEAVMSAIEQIKAGAGGLVAARPAMCRAVDSLISHGADTIVIACTELSLLAAATPASQRACGDDLMLDASEVVARHVVQLAGA